METYNSYQEAKIANPSSDIYNDIKGKFQAIKDAPTSHFANGWELCKPQNYCMTVEQFEKDGFKFSNGDWYLNLDDVAVRYTKCKGLGVDKDKSGNSKRFILRAEALLQRSKVHKTEARDKDQPKLANVKYEKVVFNMCHEAMFKHEMEEGLHVRIIGGFRPATALDVAENWGYNLYRRIVNE